MCQMNYLHNTPLLWDLFAKLRDLEVVCVHRANGISMGACECLSVLAPGELRMYPMVN